ncbi:MAG: AAA family ATPase [Burkholderiaceae bacterium]|jgi:chromosome partitioning protein|nr:AAA family ATPase [Burkholderiaceae bacterium]
MAVSKGRIILVGGEKGGTGKTTIATNLAVMRAAAGRDVVLIDTDPQGSASGWCYTRDEAGLAPRIASVQKFGKGLARELEDLSMRYQDIIVDAGGRDSVELRAAMTRAEVLVSPVQASQFDLWTLKALDELVRQAQGFNPNLRAMLVISRGPTHHQITDAKDAAELVGDYDTFSLAKSVIRDRTIYRRAAGLGQGVIEFAEQNDKASQEVQDLYLEVFGNE